MSTRMLIDARHPEETRVAVIKGNRVEEFDYESVAKRQLKGNIYLAKVTRVEPSLQACFVDYGGNRHGFLAFSEIHPDYYQIPTEDREALLAEEAQTETSKTDETEAPASESKTDSASDNADSSELDDDSEPEVEQISGEDDYEDVGRRRAQALRRHYKIQEVIKRRQILLVQVVKEERGTKGAALTTYLSLAGRYCVLMPNSQNGGGISRKIANSADRKKLKDVMASLNVPEGMGCIIRTAGLNRTKVEIKRDFDYLVRLWDGIRERTLESVAPALIHEEADLIKRSIRDLYSREIDEIQVEGENGYKLAKSFMRLLMPSHAKRVQHYKDRIPLFHRYQVENQLEAMYSPIVQLKSGGYIVINPTEALIAIDVNSGRSTKEHNIEETAYKTNLEAADEVARQLRLRDLAGLIVIDFIDMEDRGNNRSVEKRMKDALKSDRARIQVGRVSSFGLMEMSRQRLRPNLLEASMSTCPTCNGTAVVPSVEMASLNILRGLEEEGIRERSAELTVRAPASVAFYLLNQKRDMLIDLEQRYGFTLSITADANLGASPWELERVAKDPDQPVSSGKDQTAVHAHQQAEAVVQSQPAVTDGPSEPRENRDYRASSDEDDESGRKKKRRRRRRGRRGRGGDDQQQSAQSTNGTDQPSIANDDQAHAADGEQPSVSEVTEASAPQTEETKAGSDTENGERPRRRSRRRRPRTSSEQPENREEKESLQADAADDAPMASVEADGSSSQNEEALASKAASNGDDTAEAKPRKRRRVRRRTPAAAAAAGDQTAESTETTDAPQSTDMSQSNVEAPADKVAEKADAPDAEVEKPRRRRKAPVRKTAAKEKAAATDESTLPASDATSKDDGDEKPKARRTRTRKPAAPKTAPDAAPQKEASQSGKDEQKGTEKQNPAPSAPVTPAAEVEAKAAAVSDAPASASKPREDARGESAALSAPAPMKEDVIERQIITPEGKEHKKVTTTDSSEKTERKRGWWQRALGR
ncbi:ribonuclease E [Iodidimonas gelatinilytica]|uniref:Ribonuclease E n=1 Tax=Iodidimonas gelatinilytica TaxID=1236966 RepID=A0A5A7MXE8_9PROT|nr:ribonuclease E/G [Iodidimonas gelatinilytica]GER00115.1 ribonuclease E [Iodidimonas gelatinilytica]